MSKTLAKVYLTEGMSEARVSKRRVLDVRDVADRRTNVPMDILKEMPTVVMPVTTECVGKATLDPMGINETGKLSSCKLQPTHWALADWRSHTDGMP
jgi:hypothetical protein